MNLNDCIANLRKISAHLNTIDPADFTMSNFQVDARLTPLEITAVLDYDSARSGCGTVGCVIGHSVTCFPKEFGQSFSWREFSRKISGFDWDTTTWEYLFGEDNESTIGATQERIEHVIGCLQRGDSLSFSVESPNGNFFDDNEVTEVRCDPVADLVDLGTYD